MKINKILAHNINNLKRTTWASIVLFATVKDRVIEFCMNYPKLNAGVERTLYLNFCLDKCINILLKITVCFILIKMSAYWQIGIKRSDHIKATFTSHRELHHFRGLHFESRSKLETFQRTMHVILSPVK